MAFSSVDAQPPLAWAEPVLPNPPRAAVLWAVVDELLPLDVYQLLDEWPPLEPRRDRQRSYSAIDSGEAPGGGTLHV
jgi:hypothetical protein